MSQYLFDKRKIFIELYFQDFETFVLKDGKKVVTIDTKVEKN